MLKAIITRNDVSNDMVALYDSIHEFIHHTVVYFNRIKSKVFCFIDINNMFRVKI